MGKGRTSVVVVALVAVALCPCVAVAACGEASGVSAGEESNGAALGGTAVERAVNTPPGFAVRVAEAIADLTGHPFISAENKFESLSAHDAVVEASGALKRVAVSLMAVANNIRLLASGPRCGIGEISLPANEPGSSIMPGKVNPTQSEAMTMVVTRVFGNDATVGFAGTQGNFQLNVFTPVMAHAVLESTRLVADSCRSFTAHVVLGLEADRDRIAEHLEDDLMLVTALAPHLGYDTAAAIAKQAHHDGSTLREAAVASGAVSEEDYDRWVDPEASGDTIAPVCAAASAQNFSASPWASSPPHATTDIGASAASATARGRGDRTQ